MNSTDFYNPFNFNSQFRTNNANTIETMTPEEELLEKLEHGICPYCLPDESVANAFARERKNKLELIRQFKKEVEYESYERGYVEAYKKGYDDAEEMYNDALIR